MLYEEIEQIKSIFSCNEVRPNSVIMSGAQVNKMTGSNDYKLESFYEIDQNYKVTETQF
jgi:hypothetical protein